ncbi:MAG: hypothetical protein E2O88_06185 [Bacteroidetes bacterium]|nr:MAG: hypothetical protein E2O88_06185 [Bacteroidota bacterium]
MKQKPQVLIMVRIALIFIIQCVLINGCTLKEDYKSAEENGKDHKAQEIVDKAIATHGGEMFINSKISFVFRGQKFIVEQNKTSFKYEREAIQDGDSITDVYENGIFQREINGNLVTMSKKEEASAISTINSVPYFALLPYKLNDSAVIKEYDGEVTIKGEIYEKIKVTFQQEGGGKDYDNVFYYWFHKENSTMDYFGYTTEGNRFRAAYNVRVVNGIRFADYINYVSDTLNKYDLINYDNMFENNELRELSIIELEDIIVEEILVSDNH